MSVEFINISLGEWDNSKVSVVTVGERLNILYGGKVPVLKTIGTTTDTVFLLTTAKGLEDKNKYDTRTGKFTDEWDGSWSLSLKITDSVTNLRPPQEGEDSRTLEQRMKWKLITIIEHITALAGELVEEEVSAPISYKAIHVKNKAGLSKKVGVNKDGYAYLSIKVGFTAPKDADTFSDNRGNPQPVFDARKPKGIFTDLNRAYGKRGVENPAAECRVPMKTVPRTTMSISKNPKGWAMSLHLTELQYRRDDSLASQSSDADETDALLNMGNSEAELIDSIEL
jgi:hypothetical protein